MKWTHVERCKVILLATLVSGCATSTAIKAPPGLSVQADQSPDTIDKTHAWVGHYSGTGDVYVKRDHFQRMDVGINLDVRQMPGNRLWIMAMAKGHPSASFMMESEVTDPSEIVGTYQPMRGKVEYSMHREGDTITGTVDTFSSESEYGPYYPGDKWTFEVSK